VTAIYLRLVADLGSTAIDGRFHPGSACMPAAI
jgi:hypothetical protein